MKNGWQLPDIIDLEFFLLQDAKAERQGGEEQLADRDRKIFLLYCSSTEEKIKKEGKGRESHVERDRALLLCWLDAMRKQFVGLSGRILPGRLWNELFHSSAAVSVVLGLLSGSGLALSLLTYSGSRPVNVSLYLLFFVFFQIAIFFITIAIIVWERFHSTSPSHHPALSLVYRLFSWFGRILSQRLTTASWQDFQAVLGALRARGGLYSGISFWPFFILIQLFAVGFNIGVLGATLGKVAFSDVAFGWQTTLDISPEQAASIIGLIAAPWSWFMPEGIAAPLPSEIAGSRIILKDGIYRLATGDLVSWWPFLCMSVLFYGLIPRLSLLAFGRYSLRRSLSGMDLGAPCFRKIIRRMVNERISTEGERESVREAERTDLPGSGASISLHDAREAEVCTHNEGADAIVLVPDDLEPRLQEVRALLQGSGFACSDILVLDEECDIKAEPCGEGLRECVQSSHAQVVMVREAWLPPLREMVGFVRNVRALLGKERVITVALVGRPRRDGGFEDADPADMEIWRRQVAVMGDPFVEVIALIMRHGGNCGHGP